MFTGISEPNQLCNMPGGIGCFNTVQVVDEDGCLRYGRVVDVTVIGFFVELRGPRRERRLFPFGRVYRPRQLNEAALAGKAAAETGLQVLVRETPSGHWIWAPVENIRVGRGEAAVVQWRTNGSDVSYTDIVPVDRLRWPFDPAHRYQHIKPGAFTKRSVRLDAQFASLSADAAAAMVRAASATDSFGRLESRVAMVGIVNGRLDILYAPQDWNSCDAEDREFVEILAHLDLNLKHCLEASKNPPEIADCSMLPAELWTEVFSHLDTVTQTALRLVSPDWTAILTGPTLTAAIVITSQKSARFRYYISAVLFKCLSPGSQHLVLTDWEEDVDMGDLMALAGTINFVAAQHPGVRLQGLWLRGVRLQLLLSDVQEALPWDELCTLHGKYESSDLLTDYHGDYFVRLRDFTEVYGRLPCDAIGLKDCSLLLGCSVIHLLWQTRTLAFLPARIGASRMALGVGFACALWQTLDTAAAEPFGPERKEVARLLDSAKDPTKTAQKMVNTAVCQVLCAVQSADPRPSSHYPGKRWCVDGLQDVQLEQLSRLTRHFLTQL